MKDYYKILELEVSATQPEIKKAYRRLAQQYHPDKNPQDPYAAATFSEIKEAYEVLTNPAKKEYYLEQRWFQQSMGKKKADTFTTPVTILKDVLAFDRHVSMLDIHRMNKEGLFTYFDKELLPGDHISMLNGFGDAQINTEIISLVLKNLAVIPAARIPEVKSRLLRINADASTKEMISSTISIFEKKQSREKYQVWIILLIVILVSVLIFFASR